MNILIAGASGFVGQELTRALSTEHHVTAVGRKNRMLGHVACCSWDELSTLNAQDYHAVINLCGYNIAASRWSQRVKKQIINSRVKTNTLLLDWINKYQAKPRFLCANAVGIYGLQSNDDPTAFDETSFININQPADFLSETGIQWQESLKPAVDLGLQVTTLRFGVVLKKNGGMLQKLLPSFYLGMGSKIGDGKQCISWVHMNDVVNAIGFLLKKPELTGAFNITSPHPVTQEQFARTLANIMHRPLFLTIPAIVIRMLFGEMGECLLLKGQRVLPKRLLDEGYLFQYPQLIDALKQEFNH